MKDQNQLALSSSFFKNHIVALFILFMVIWLNNTWVKPSNNFDMLMYIGVMFSYESDDKAEIYTKSYTSVKNNVSDHTYMLLTSASVDPYRANVAASADLFNQQLRYYTVKPMYPRLMQFLYHLGVDPVSATHMISKTCGLLLLLVLFVFLYAIGVNSTAAALVTLFISFTNGFTNTIYLSTPDTLASLYVVAAVALLLFNNKYIKIGLLLLVFSIWIRPDNILVSGLCSALFFLFAPKYRNWAFMTGVLTLATYLLNVNYLNDVGWKWSTHFYFTTIGSVSDPDNFVSPLKFNDYLNTYNSMWQYLILRDGVSMYFFLSVATIYLCFIQFGLRHRYTLISIMVLLCLFSHWLVLPFDKQRMLLYAFFINVMMIFGIFRRDHSMIKALKLKYNKDIKLTEES